MGAENAKVTFLNQVIQVTDRGKSCVKPTAEERFIGLNFLGKPASLIRAGPSLGDYRG